MDHVWRSGGTRALVGAAAALLASCASAAAPHAPAPVVDDHADELGLPRVRGPLTFPADAEPVTLAWLVDELARLTGQELALAPVQLREQLLQQEEPLELRTPVPPNEVYSFVEALLAPRGIVFVPLASGERPVLGVFGTATRAFDLQAVKPVALQPGQFDALDRHPAVYFQLQLDFRNIDSRQLQTQLRQLLVDTTGLQQVVPCGERSLMLQGTGAKLAGLVRLLQDVDRASGTEPAPASGAR